MPSAKRNIVVRSGIRVHGSRRNARSCRVRYARSHCVRDARSRCVRDTRSCCVRFSLQWQQRGTATGVAATAVEARRHRGTHAGAATAVEAHRHRGTHAGTATAVETRRHRSGFEVSARMLGESGTGRSLLVGSGSLGSRPTGKGPNSSSIVLVG